MIIVKQGTIGYWDGRKVVPYTEANGAIELDSAAEARFVKLGVAAYVGEPTDTVKAPAYSVDMKPAALREIGKTYGLIFKVGMSKADMVAALDEYFNPAESDEGANGEDEETDEGANGEDGDVLDTDEDVEDDGEDAPTFDSTEAVY